MEVNGDKYGKDIYAFIVIVEHLVFFKN
jgi:hypothetical protein